MRAPAIWILFQVFVAESIFKGSAMEVKGDYIGCRESALGQLREEQLVNDAVAFDANPALLLPSGMSRHHHATTRP
jgi:hypothetical protein